MAAAATDDEKAKKAAEKARRKAEFEAKRAKEGNPPKKKQLSKAETAGTPGEAARGKGGEEEPQAQS